MQWYPVYNAMVSGHVSHAIILLTTYAHVSKMDDYPVYQSMMGMSSSDSWQFRYTYYPDI